MAENQAEGLIQQIKISNSIYNLASTAYGVCETFATEPVKLVDMPGFELKTGVTVHIKFTYNNATSNPTLNINQTGAKPIVQYGTTIAGNSDSSSGWYAGAVISFTYDGTSWVRDQGTSVHNTQDLIRPTALNGVGDVTYQSLFNDVRANRLAFLPADQIIIEKTTDGGATWEDAGISDSTKTALFSQTRPGVSLPMINNKIDINCGLRITITGMKYNVPAGTPETEKYNYWNSSYVISNERYNQIKLMYFWVSAATNAIKVTVQRATGSNSNNWLTIFNKDNYGMNGWSGNDVIRFSQGAFGGGPTQTSNYWNWRIILMTCGPNGSSTLNQSNLTSAMVVSEIRGYGDTWWSAGNNLAAKDHIYTWDWDQNVTFPKSIFSNGQNRIPHTGNATGSVGSNAIPVYIDAGTIKPVTLADNANALINALSVGFSPATANDYLIAQYAGGGSTTTTYHRKKVSDVVNATIVKAALGTDTSTTTQWLNKKGEWSTPTAAQVGAITKLSSSTDNAIVRFDGTSGAIQDSGVIIDDSNNVTIPGQTLKITSTSGTKFILIGNQNSSGENKPLVMKSSNGNLTIGAGNDWSSLTGGTLNTTLFVGASGNVGIKTNNPTYALTIDGDASATNFRGNLIGNADTATEFSSGTTVKLTGDITGESSSSTKGWSVATTIGDGKVTNAKLANSSLKVGHKSISLGGTGTLDEIILSSTNINATSSWDITTSGAYYVVSGGSAFTGTQNPGINQNMPYGYGALYVIRAGNGGAVQFYINHKTSSSTSTDGGIRYRSGWNIVNGSRENGASPWVSWATILDDKNYNLYTPKLDGTGATGSWNIKATNVTGIVAIANGGTGTATTTPNYIFAGPSAGSTAEAPSFRKLVAADIPDLSSTYLKLDGSNNMTADINIIARDTDKFVNFWYNANKKAGASWRIGMLGSGTGDANYFIIQSGTSSESATSWNDVFRIGQNTFNIHIPSTTASTSTSTGALTVGGGLGVAEQVVAGTLKSGNITIGGTIDTNAGKTFSSNSTLYINRGSSCSIIFQEEGTNKLSIDTSNNFIPATTNTLSIGTSNKKWNAMYATTFYGDLNGTFNGYQMFSPTRSPQFWYKYTMTYTTTTIPTADWYVKIILDRSYEYLLTPILIISDYSNKRGSLYWDLDSYNNLWRAYLTTYNSHNIKAIGRKYENSKNNLYIQLAAPEQYGGSVPQGTLTIYSPVEIISIEQLNTAPSNLQTLYTGYNSNTHIKAANLYGTLATDNLSGQVAIANGGTGASTAAEAWTALGGGASGKHDDSYFAKASHNHAASDINSGTFDVARIPNLSWNKITSNKPTTISGYGITDAKIASGTITLGSNTISPVTAITWDSTNKKLTRTINGTAADVVTAATLRTDLGLSNALHFIGITSTTLADGSTTSTLTAKSTGSLTKTTGFVDGDVVMDGDQLREYVWSGSAWRLLGITTSIAYSETTSGNTFISSISQGTDGKITADSRALDTSGTWSGTATKATTTVDTSNALYVIGVTSSATTTLKRDTSVTVTGGAVSATTYNGLTLTAASTGFTITGGTTSKTLTVSDTLTLKTGMANYVAYYSAAGTISGHSQAHFSDTWSSSTKNGKNELVLGNSVASTSNGSAYGQLALYSENTAGTYLKSESGTSWETATLQAKTGTIALMSDVIESKVEIIRLA